MTENVPCTSCESQGCGLCGGLGYFPPGVPVLKGPPSPRWKLCPVCRGAGCIPASPLVRWCSGGRLPERLWDDLDFVGAYAIATGSAATDMAALDVVASATDGADAFPTAPDAPQGRQDAPGEHDPAATPITPVDAEMRTTAAVAQPDAPIVTAEGVLGGSGDELARNRPEPAKIGIELAGNRPEPAKTGTERPPRVIVVAPRRRGRRATDGVSTAR